MDNLKLLEPQINTMCKYCYQLASFGDPITGSKFTMILSESLPPSYETLKMVTVASVSDVLKLATDMLIVLWVGKSSMLYQAHISLNYQVSGSPS